MSNVVNYKSTNRVEVDIRRPNGIVETVDVSDKYHRMNDVAFANIKAATLAAGRGDALCYRNIEVDAVYAKSAGDLQDDSHDAIVKMSRMGD